MVIFKKSKKSPQCWVFKSLTIDTNQTPLLCHITVSLMWPPLQWENIHKSLPGSGTKPVLTRIQPMSQHRNYTNCIVGVPPWLCPSIRLSRQQRREGETGNSESLSALLAGAYTTNLVMITPRMILRSSRPQEIFQPPQREFFSVHAQLQVLGNIFLFCYSHITSPMGALYCWAIKINVL